MNNINHAKSNSEKPTLWSVGWLVTFGAIPLGSSVPGLLLLLIDRIKSLFKKQHRSEIQTPSLVVWVNRLYTGLLAIGFISCAFSIKPWIALASITGYTLMIVIFFHGGQKFAINEEFLSNHYLSIFTIASVFAASVSILRYFIQPLSAAVDLVGGENGFGTILILLGGLGIGYLAWLGRKKQLLAIPYLGIITAALLLTRSRGGWVGFAAMILCFTLFNRKFWSILLIIALFCGVLFLASPLLQERLLSIFSLQQSTNAERIYIWKVTLNMIQDHPLLGVGPGIYPFTYDKYTQPGIEKKFLHKSFAHNLYLQVPAELGIPAFIIFCGILGIVLYMGFSLAKTGHPVYQGLFASIMGVLVHQFFDIPIWGIDIGGAFWMFCGLTVGLYQLYQLKKVSKLNSNKT